MLVGLAGNVLMVVLGGVVSIVQVRVTVIPAPMASLANTANDVAPSGKPVALGEAVVTPIPLQDCVPPLKLQQIVDASEEVTVKFAALLATVLPCAGPVSMVTVGRMVSIVQKYVAGVASVLPAKSVAFARKVWPPSVKPG